MFASIFQFQGQEEEEEAEEEQEAQPNSKRRKHGDGMNLGGSVFASADDFQNIIDGNVRDSKFNVRSLPRTILTSLPAHCGRLECNAKRANVDMVAPASLVVAAHLVVQAEVVDRRVEAGVVFNSRLCFCDRDNTRNGH